MTSAMTHQLKNQISYIYLLYSSIRYFLDLSIKYLIFFICFCEQNLQQQMKNLSYISYLKNSMMELVKNSTDSAEDQDEAEQQKQTYYREFIKMRKMKKCTINNVQTIPGMRFNRPYAVYHIAVVTTDFTYKVVKRYSEFEKLYGQCIKVMTFQQSFPQKTLWSSGYQEQITAIRQIQLNKIIKQINQEQTPDVVKYKFYQFINLYNKNEEFVANNKQQKYYNQQFILNSISQFHSLNKQTLHLFKDIENSMAQSKRKISYELSKQMLMGFNGNQGIIPFVLNNNNQLIVIAGLHLINWLFSPEMNKDSQIFNKVLQKMSPHFLLLQFYIDFKDSQIKIQYFQLLSIYLQLREDLTIQSICGNGEQEEMLREDYIKWANWKKVKEF